MMAEELNLRLATKEDAKELHRLQVEAFMPLYEKYQDDETSPAKESLETVLYKVTQENADFYMVEYDGKNIGGVRIRWHQNGKVTENINFISPIFILPQYQNKGIATKVLQRIFAMYPDTREWRLDTIKQEEGNCHLYEKCGFVRVGEETVINDRMTLVDYVRRESDEI